MASPMTQTFFGPFNLNSQSPPLTVVPFSPALSFSDNDGDGPGRFLPGVFWWRKWFQSGELLSTSKFQIRDILNDFDKGCWVSVGERKYEGVYCVSYRCLPQDVCAIGQRCEWFFLNLPCIYLIIFDMHVFFAQVLILDFLLI